MQRLFGGCGGRPVDPMEPAVGLEHGEGLLEPGTSPRTEHHVEVQLLLPHQDVDPAGQGPTPSGEHEGTGPPITASMRTLDQAAMLEVVDAALRSHRLGAEGTGECPQRATRPAGDATKHCRLGWCEVDLLELLSPAGPHGPGEAAEAEAEAGFELEPVAPTARKRRGTALQPLPSDDRVTARRHTAPFAHVPDSRPSGRPIGVTVAFATVFPAHTGHFARDWQGPPTAGTAASQRGCPLPTRRRACSVHRHRVGLERHAADPDPGEGEKARTNDLDVDLEPAASAYTATRAASHLSSS